MNTKTVSVTLDPVTWAVLKHHAGSRGQALPEAISAILYRQAAVMTGWPGGQGKDLEAIMLDAARPYEPAVVEEIP